MPGSRSALSLSNRSAYVSANDVICRFGYPLAPLTVAVVLTVVNAGSKVDGTRQADLCQSTRAVVPQPRGWARVVTSCQWHSSKDTPLVYPHQSSKHKPVLNCPEESRDVINVYRKSCENYNAVCSQHRLLMVTEKF